MGILSPIDIARREYALSVEAFKQARINVTQAKRNLAKLESKARTPAQIKANRLSQRRAQVLRNNPHLRQITNAARRREAVDAILSQRDRARVWKFYLDDMTVDSQTRAPKVLRQNRTRFWLYWAGLTASAKLWKQEAGRLSNGSPAITDAGKDPRELRNNARTLELHLQGLVDAAPREVRVHYPSEWRVISRALRPEGMRPKGKGARRLLALYQHIVRTHTEEAP